MSTTEKPTNIELIKQLAQLCTLAMDFTPITRVIAGMLEIELKEYFKCVPSFGFPVSANESEDYIALAQHVRQTTATMKDLIHVESVLSACGLLIKSYDPSQYYNVHVMTNRPHPLMYKIAPYAVSMLKYTNSAQPTLITFKVSEGIAALTTKNLMLGILSNLAQVPDLDRADLGVLIASYLSNVLNYPADELAYYGIKPVDAGDVPSKSQAGIYHQLGLITHVIYDGEDGYRALTYLGNTVAELMKAHEVENAKSN